MKRLGILLALSLPLWGATNNVTATAIHRVWSTGATPNGSCFDPSNQGATGVDYSQNASAHVTVTTGLTTSGANATTITQTGATWDNTLLGNCIHITAGTNFVQGFYVVTGFTDSNNLVLNVSPTTAGAGSVGTGAIGGAVSTIATAETAVVAGNTVYIKSTATYTIAANINFATGGSSGLPITWIGYTSTDTDGGPAVLQISTGTVSIITGSGNFQRFFNFTLDCNSQTTSRGANYTGTNSLFGSLTVKNCITNGLNITGASNLVKNSYFTTNTGPAFSTNAIGQILEGNVFVANTGAPINDTSTTASGINVYLRNVICGNTGGTTDGFFKAGASGALIWGNTICSNGRDGLRMTAATSLDTISIRNNIIYGNTGVGINSTTTNWSTHNYWTDINYNGVGGNGTDRTNVPTGGSDVTLTADPFTNSAGNVYTLNSTAGGGASLKAAGYPAAMPSTAGTGYPDIGSLQSQCSGGGAVTHSCSH